MKRTTIGILVLFLLIAFAQAQPNTVFGADVYRFANYNCVIQGLGYIPENSTLYLYAVPNDSNESIGLGLIMMKFNINRAPQWSSVKATINGRPAVDMLKNYTYADGSIFVSEWINETYIREEIMPCKYLEIYFYLFENHSITNEQIIETNFGPEWNDTSHFIPSSEKVTNGNNIKSSSQVLIEITDEEATPISFDIVPIAIFASTVIIITMVVIVLVRMRKD